MTTSERPEGTAIINQRVNNGPAVNGLSPITIVVGTFLAGAAALGFFFDQSKGGQGIGFPPQMANVAQTLAPLFAVAAFIERAVEIVISTWRDAGADLRGGPNLVEYKRQTKSYAYMLSFGLSLFASAVGVRGLSSLVDPSKLGALSPRQHLWFTGFDVVLTALLLSGGSDGIHQVVTMITGFLDSTKAKNNTTA
jgi:hypothetical protein